MKSTVLLGCSVGTFATIVGVWSAACVGDDPSAVGAKDAGRDGPSVDADNGAVDSSTDGCGDTTGSAANCGSCGHACLAGYPCIDGRCGEEIVRLVTSRGFPPTTYPGQLVCAVQRSGALSCWGDAADGQLGVALDAGESFADSARRVALDVDGAPFAAVFDVAGAESTTCALHVGGGGSCWGSNGFGQYGNGTAAGSTSLPSRTIDTGLVGFEHLSATLAGFCAIDADGAVWCWGYNNEYELGHDHTSDIGSPPYNPTPTRVVFPFPDAGTEKVLQVAGGPVHACALVESGHVYCWGHNQWGNVGNDTSGADVPNATLVVGPGGETSGLGGVVELAAGSDYTCARTAAKTVYCWGYGGNGNIGNGAQTNINPRPVQVKGPGGTGVLAGAESIGVGWFHACAVVTGGNVSCWGTNTKGELGIGNADPSVRTAPTEMVKGPAGTGVLSDVVTVVGLRSSTCVLKNDNTIWCWGENQYSSTYGGYLGNADPNHADSPYPVQVKGIP